MLGAKFKLHCIRYFTARIKTRGNDPRKHLRQQVYLRALNTIPELIIHEGHFLSNAVWMPLASPRPGQSSLVEVIRTEEKGSDANLAAWLTRDAAKRGCQAAFVVTGDSDFAGVIQMVRQEFSFPVYVIDPAGASSSRLRGTSTTYNPLDRKLLPLCQFPSVITDRRGRTITKPREWD